MCIRDRSKAIYDVCSKTMGGVGIALAMIGVVVLSLIHILLVLTGLGAAILLNNGTNLIFGTISFVTNAAGSILQLAVSLDYSVFLIHRFAECRACLLYTSRCV